MAAEREWEPAAAAPLRESEVAPEPFGQFEAWLKAAVAARLPQPVGMTLATATLDGRPSARLVLLRGFDSRGFVFFTNYESRKARELEANPHAALVFYWAELERQVRIEGTVERVSSAESDEYFASRPRGSRLGAWASPQSQTLGGRSDLEQRLAEILTRFGDGDVPRPPFWGGYRVVPATVEFWQGQPDRLHDRLLYRRTAAGGWTLTRLAP